jgi:hypothetical protein
MGTSLPSPAFALFYNWFKCDLDGTVQQMQEYGERVSFSFSVGLAFFSQDSNQYYVQ